MLKPGAVVVDVGINVVDGRIVGDVDFASAVTVASAITPVPGRRRAADQRAPADPPDPRRRAPAGRPPAAPTSAPHAPSPPEEIDELPVRPRDRPFRHAAPDRRHRRRAGHPGRRDRALRSDQGQGHARGHHAPRGGAPARQVRGRHRDHPDAARRGQVDDDGRARPGPQQDRPQGLGQHPPAVARAGVRHQGRRRRRRLQPGHPDGGLQPPPDRRRPRHRRGPQPRRRLHRQQPPPQEPAGHRPARGPLAARRRHQRPRPPARGHRAGRSRERRPARDRVRHHRRLGGDGGPRAGDRPLRPAGAARPDRPGDAPRRHARSPPRTSGSPAR